MPLLLYDDQYSTYEPPVDPVDPTDPTDPTPEGYVALRVNNGAEYVTLTINNGIAYVPIYLKVV